MRHLLMSRFSPRHLLIGLILSGAVCAQFLLMRYLDVVSDQPPVPLKKPLAAIPLRIGAWQGRNLKIDEREEFGDETVKRVYYHPQRKQRLTLWMVYSKVGADRSHHPEICMAVAGLPEDRRSRRSFAVAGHPEPVQQFRFGRTGSMQRVFYWYYTLPRSERPDTDQLQRLYRKTHSRPSSVTIEVFAPENVCDEKSAREFVQLVDAAVQAHVGKGAVRESRRVPIAVHHEARPPQLP